ncbi:hemerythrin domain-containing protein [Ramlibacter sp. PS3R-8]|uniref:hemerythrin domain-containing protein n=1 Tax=Ramlibacter sp. PS3R-8 TaxID=3133437 RepID=UPI0030A698B8
MPQQLIEKDACDLLDADHVAVKHLFVEYARLAVAGDPAGERQAYAQKICNELTVHAQIEEEIFYPALREVIDAPELLDEAEAEHQEAKDMIAALEGMPAADAGMDDLVAKLAAAIEHHVKEERTQLFPKARSAKGLDLDALGAQLKQRQQELEAEMAA